MYLIDTDTIIYALKGHPAVTGAIEARASYPMALSVISYGELIHGAIKSKQRPQNLARIRRLSETHPLIDVTRGVMETFGELKAGLETRGTPLDDLDLVIAATALMLNYTLVTNNEKHFRRIPGLKVENWSRSK